MKKNYFLIFAFVYLGIATADAQYSVILSFNNTNCSNPNGSLTLSGKMLYGMTYSGGANGNGAVFSVDTNGNGFKVLVDFNGLNSPQGASPSGSLILSGRLLFGMTSAGGANNDGCIFSVDTNGNGYKDIADFEGVNFPQGSNPLGSLTLSGNVLYGMTQYGCCGYGNIFSVDTNGTGYVDMLEFSNGNGAIADGSLALAGNMLYGMTWGGGDSSVGNIFAIHTNGTGFKDLFDFNGVNGWGPQGSLTIAGKALYGMTTGGGNAGDCVNGNIFSIDTNGSNFHVMLDFNVLNGQSPLYTALSLSGNLLYGMTWLGGANNNCCIFSIDTTGHNYKDLIDFSDQGYPQGSQPYSSLTISGNELFGMTTDGGDTSEDGVIFKLNLAGLNSINELSANSGGLKLYPNPNNGKFTIAYINSAATSSSQTDLEIYNLLGEKVYNATLNKAQSNSEIDLSAQSAGMYFIYLKSEEGVMEGKVMIVKE